MRKNMKANTKARAKAKRDMNFEHEQTGAAPKKTADQQRNQDIKKQLFEPKIEARKKTNQSTKRVNNKMSTNLNRHRKRM